MLTPYQVIRSKKSQPAAAPRPTLTPQHHHLSFSHEQHCKSPSRHRLKRAGHLSKNETEELPRTVELAASQKFEVVVREGQKKRPTYRFTYTEAHEEGRAYPEGNFRLVIEGGHCRKDLLKLNRRKLEDMIAKIREGKSELPGQPSNIAEMVLQKCQPRSRAFFMAEPRKSLDWKAQIEQFGSPKQFDTREYLVCHSVRQEAREGAREGSGAGRREKEKERIGPCGKGERQAGRSSYKGFSSKKYRRNEPTTACKTEQKLKNSSLSLFDHSTSFKRVQTTSSFNPNNLKGWEPAQERQSFFEDDPLFD